MRLAQIINSKCRGPGAAVRRPVEQEMSGADEARAMISINRACSVGRWRDFVFHLE